jgi:hypothetical protein
VSNNLSLMQFINILIDEHKIKEMIYVSHYSNFLVIRNKESKRRLELETQRHNILVSIDNITGIYIVAVMVTKF